MSSSDHTSSCPDLPQEDDLLDADDAAEEIAQDLDLDHPMDEEEEEDGDVQEEIDLHNDSAAHFDNHTDSVFCIAQHPTDLDVVITGGGDDVAYVFDSSLPDAPLLPSSYEASPETRGERKGIRAIQRLDGHTDSVNAVAFTLPSGRYAVTAGLDGKIRAWQSQNPKSDWSFVAEAQEVQEINWLVVCPHPGQADTFAVGAHDGSVWVHRIDASGHQPRLEIVQTFYLHTQSCTAGAWTRGGKLLATVGEDGSFYVYDVFGEAAAAGVSDSSSGQAIVSLTAADQRFTVEGGLYSVAISPGGAIAAVGGAGGNVRIVGLPRLGAAETVSSTKVEGNVKSKVHAGGKKASASAQASASQAGQILASLQAQSDGIESLSFSQPPLTLLAAGSVDGSIALFDVAHRFAVRRHIKEAHEDFAVVKVDFIRNSRTGGWLLTSAGMDGVVRRWDARGGTTAAGHGLVQEWRGHRGEGEGGGVLGFVQGTGEKIVTAGDDGVSLVFRAEVA